MSKPEHSPLPKCVITGRIAGDQFACGDCDPCIKGAFIVPQEVQDLLAERDEFASKYENAEVRYDDNQSAIKELVEALQRFAMYYPMGINPDLDDAYRAAIDLIAKHKAES